MRRIRKIGAIFLALICASLVSFGQVSLDGITLRKVSFSNAKIIRVLETIEKLANADLPSNEDGLRVLLRGDPMKLPRIHLEINNLTLSRSLDYLCNQIGATYAVFDNVILVDSYGEYDGSGSDNIIISSSIELGEAYWFDSDRTPEWIRSASIEIPEGQVPFLLHVASRVSGNDVPSKLKEFIKKSDQRIIIYGAGRRVIDGRITESVYVWEARDAAEIAGTLLKKELDTLAGSEEIFIILPSESPHRWATKGRLGIRMNDLIN